MTVSDLNDTFNQAVVVVAARLAHRRRAQQFIGMTPLPTLFQECDRLSGHQRIQVALLFSIKEELVPLGEGHPTIMPWKRTVIQEYDEELALEWAVSQDEDSGFLSISTIHVHHGFGVITWSDQSTQVLTT